MDIKEQRVAIYKAETAIEAVLDALAEDTGFQAKTINIQNVWDNDKNIEPAVKVNIVVSRHKDER